MYYHMRQGNVPWSNSIAYAILEMHDFMGVVVCT